MPRTRREKSSNQCYHLIIRGINQQIIFEEDSDKSKFMECVRRAKEETKIKIYAYCLMDNHVHFLLRSPEDNLDIFMKKLGSSYVYYFNRKYDRIGYLFQDRYKSFPITNTEKFISCAKYIMLNPQNAGIAQYDAYIWSSWVDYYWYKNDVPDLTPDDDTDTELLLKIVGGFEKLKNILDEPDDASDDNPAEKFECYDNRRPSDERAVEIIMDKIMGQEPGKINEQPRPIRNQMIKDIKATGLSSRQVSRITGVNREMIRRLWGEL